jgi:AbrB family looped-hinge helix DNA binding protein
MQVAKILGKGQLVIPKRVREQMKLSPGDNVEIRVDENKIIILPIRKNYTDTFKGMVKGKLSLEALEKLYAEKD